MLNVITANKLSDTDNVVDVRTDVNLLILLSKRSYHSNAYSCVHLELVIFIVPFNRLNGFYNTSTLIQKERHLN